MVAGPARCRGMRASGPRMGRVAELSVEQAGRVAGGSLAGSFSKEPVFVNDTAKLPPAPDAAAFPALARKP